MEPSVMKASALLLVDLFHFITIVGDVLCWTGVTIRMQEGEGKRHFLIGGAARLIVWNSLPLSGR
jgi:hypothetical protein